MQDLGPNNKLQCLVCEIVLGFELQMARRRNGSLLRKELDSLSFLQVHPEVQKHFLNAGCMEYVERLQNGCHQSTVEAFSKTFDGNKACVGSLEIIVDEVAIDAATSLPRSGQSWFKTTATKNLNFRATYRTTYREEKKHIKPALHRLRTRARR